MIYLSIIIPHYNSIKSLTKLLRSIPTNPAIEIIVIDDLSTKCGENYKKLAVEFNKKNNIKFLSREKWMPKGAGTCRNIGLEKAVGKYILFADADDFFKENFMEILFPYLSKNNDVVFFAPYCIIPSSNTEGVRHLPYIQLIKNYLKAATERNTLALRYKYHVPWSKLISKSLLDKHQIFFDETLASNDVMFSTKLGNKMKYFEVSSEMIYVVTQNDSSLTRMKENSLFDVRTKVFVDYYQYLKENITHEEFEDFSLSGARVLFSAIKEKRGVKQFMKTVKIFTESNVKLFKLNDLKYMKLLLR